MPLKILIVDNEEMMFRLYSRIFLRPGLYHPLATNVTSAAALIKANRYDLLITDLKLGDGLGTELTLLFTKESPNAKSLIVTGAPP